MALQDLLKVHAVKQVDQKAFDGRVNHRGFPNLRCVQVPAELATGLAPAKTSPSNNYPEMSPLSTLPGP